MTAHRDQPPLFVGDASGRLPLVYVASPLSSLTSREKQLLDAWCKNVEDAILNERTGVAEWTLRTHFPFQQSAPWRNDSRDPQDVYELNSRLLWGEVDAVILFDLRGGSLGAGMELAWAGSMAVPVLVVVPKDDRVSRQVAGMAQECDVTVVSFEDAADLQVKVRSWLNERRVLIESAELRRTVHRQRAHLFREALRARWSGMSQNERSEALRRAQMKRARVARLINDPDALIQASLHELLTLAAALGTDLGRGLSPRGRQLATAQLRSLQQAAVECNWGTDAVIELVVRAHAELASTAVRRLPLGSIEDWVRFKESQLG